MVTFAIFVGCTSNIHAGVEMEIITGRSTLEGAGGNLPRILVRSTLTGELLRVNPMLLRSLAGLTQDEIDELAFDVECDCPEIIQQPTTPTKGAIK